MYTQTVTHNHRAAFIIAIDCSTSMQEMTRLNTTVMSKANAAALVCNMLIDELLIRSTRNNRVKNYYDMAVIGYSGDGVESLLPGSDSGFISMERLAEHEPPLYVTPIDQRLPTGMTISAPITLHQWIKPKAQGKTPMYEALVTIYDMVSEWCNTPENRDSFPPMIFNISDGDCSDSNDNGLISIAEDIKSTSTNDGNTLLINIHLSALYNDYDPEIFPSARTFSTSNRSRMTLCKMSSEFPQFMDPVIKRLTTTKEEGPYRAVAYDATIFELMSIVNIGTESASNIWSK